MANISTVIDERQVFAGPAVISIGIVGVTPTEIGAVANVSLSAYQEYFWAERGFPRMKGKKVIVSKGARITFDAMEVADYETLRFAMGTGYYVYLPGGPPVYYEYYFGENSNTDKRDECSMLITHTGADGDSVERVYIYRATGVENIERSYADEDIHSTAYTFELLYATQDWGGTPITTDQSRLFWMQLERTLP